MSEEYIIFCENYGSRRQITVSYSPQQNEIEEKRYKTLLDMVISMLSRANLSVSFWAEANLSICSQVSSKSILKTPYELWTGRFYLDI